MTAATFAVRWRGKGDTSDVRVARTRRHSRLIAVLGAVAVFVLAGVSVEPLRGSVQKSVGQQCGTVMSIPGSRVIRDVMSNEQCLQFAAQRCHAASLASVRTGLDTRLAIWLSHHI